MTIEDKQNLSFHELSPSSFARKVITVGGQAINPLAKYVEAVYTNSDMTVTYSYYESASKVTLYNTITLIFTEAQDTTFTSAAWA
jgi:hypothetical protein